MKNYDRFALNELAVTYRKMILNEAPPPEEPLRPGKRWPPAHTFKPPVPGWYPVGFPPDHLGEPNGFPKDRRFITPDNPKGYWRWHDPADGYRPGPLSPPPPPKPGRPTPTPQPQPATPAKPRPAPKPARPPMRLPRGGRVGGGVLGAATTLYSLYDIYQQLFGDDGVEVDVIPGDGEVIKPVNSPTPGLDLSPMQVPEHLRNPHSYPGQHPVRPSKASAGGSQGSGGGIGGGGGMGM